MPSVLVTGGAGFIGSHLVDELLRQGHKVCALDNLVNGTRENLKSALENPDFELVVDDILDSAACRRAASGRDVVFHLACLGVRHSLHSPFENHRVNAEGSLNVLQASRDSGVRRFFYVSTSEVYGDTPTFPIVETSQVAPTTVYGASKLAGENYAAAYYKCFGLAATVLRVFNNYGPRAHYEGDAGEIIPRTIVNALYGKAPVLFGDGGITRDFFFVKDTARVLAALLRQTGLEGEVINVGTGVEITMKELMLKLLALMGKAELGIRFLDPRPGDVPRLWVDPGKFQRLTGFGPGVAFESGLRETIAFYSEVMKREDLIARVAEKNWTG